MENIEAGFKTLIGVSFITVLVDILLTDTSYKKYIRSILGLIMILIIIQSFINFKDIKIDLTFFDNLETKTLEKNNLIETTLNNETSLNIEKKIKSRLQLSNIKVVSSSIDLTTNYEIEAIILYIEDYLKNKGLTIDILSKEFNIDKNLIEVRDAKDN